MPDEDPEESGVYAANEGKVCKSKSFSFMSWHTNLCYFKTEPLTLRQFGKMWGYELWHRRLGQISEILSCILDWKICYPRHYVKCPSCMIGKSTLEDLPKLKNRAMEPLVQVNMDIFLSSVQSIKGYNFAVVFVDCTTGYRWRYGINLKRDVLTDNESCQERVH